MTIPQDILRKHAALNEWSILTAYRGSIAHGMYVPNTDPNSIDDKDVMAVCVPPIEYYFGQKNFGSRGTKEIFEGEWDIVIYELRKFIALLAKGNPNVLSLLWVDERHILSITEAGNLLRERRDLFATKMAYESFVGYAYGQLKRMTHLACEGYMGEKRKKLVQKFGYDTKNAAHLIRLLRMGVEFLNEGTLHVTREDAGELLQIKRGEWELERVKEEAERLFKKIDGAAERSTLPAAPDKNEINTLSVEVVRLHLNLP